MNQKQKISGVLFLIATAQFALALVTAGSLQPNYSLSEYYISDLGVGPYSAVFNSSAILLGLMLLFGAYFLRGTPGLRTLSILLVLMGFAVVAVGVFTKDFPLEHGIVSSIAFFFSGVAAISSAKVLKTPFSLAGIVLGVMTIGALALFSVGMVASGSLTSTTAYDSSFYLGLGPGGMECMIVSPALLWLAMFSGYLIAQREFKEL